MYRQESKYSPLNDSVAFFPPNGESQVKLAALAKLSILTPTPPNMDIQKKLYRHGIVNV